MAKTSQLKPKKVAKGSSHSWRLSVPPKYSATGKRQQLFFATEALAKAHASTLKVTREEYGTQAKSITPSLAEMATSAAKRLEPYGVTITDIVNRFIEEQERLLASVPIETAIKKFRTAKDGRSDSQTAAYKMMGDRMIEDFAGRSMASITGKEITDHLDKQTTGLSAFNLRLRLISAFIRWCAKEPRTWCQANIVSHIERKETVSSEVGTLTSSEVAKLMATAEKYFPDTVPAFAIALFTGMRQQEIDRLEPSDITDDGITVPASSAKTKRRRFIHMPETLAAWLKVYPITDYVTPPNWSRKEKAVRRLAGWKVWSDLVPQIDIKPKLFAEPPADAPEWPQNALRHTAASVALANGKPLETLIFEHGHAGGVEMMRKHYIGRMTKSEAIKIWSLGPKGKKLPAFKVA